MKSLYILLICLLFGVNSQAQDVLKLSDGTTVSGKIIESNKSKIRFKVDGDTIIKTIPRSYILGINETINRDSLVHVSKQNLDKEMSHVKSFQVDTNYMFKASKRLVFAGTMFLSAAVISMYSSIDNAKFNPRLPINPTNDEFIAYLTEVQTQSRKSYQRELFSKGLLIAGAISTLSSAAAFKKGAVQLYKGKTTNLHGYLYPGGMGMVYTIR